MVINNAEFFKEGSGTGLIVPDDLPDEILEVILTYEQMRILGYWVFDQLKRQRDMSKAGVNCSVTVMPITEEGKIGFIRRKEGESFAGLLVAPGGKVEPTDGIIIDGVPYYSVEAAAVREMKEEVGLILEAEHLVFLTSLTLPEIGRVVISMYCWTLEWQSDTENEILWLDRNEIESRDDFAPGMKQEAIILLDREFSVTS